jgi:hypothetical protein
VQTPQKVLSVPSGKTHHLIHQHFVYSCPDSLPWDDQPTKLITFRPPPERRMENIYTVERIVTLNPLDIEAAYDIPEKTRTRIADYIRPAQHHNVLNRSGTYRFYILDLDKIIALPHRPKPDQDYPGAIYFSLDDLQRGDATVTPLHD